jgi:anti-sigma regulatory factor (Ser/Thr protein kinase)
LLGAQVRQWPGIPIGLIFPDRDVREGLTGAAEGRYLAIAETGAAVWGELSTGAATATVRVTLAPEPRSARAARDFVAQTCSDWGCSHQVLAATLIASELVTNAVRGGAGWIDLTVRATRARLDLLVEDDAGGWPVLAEADDDAVGGRGLGIVDRLTDTWMVTPRVRGKVVTASWLRRAGRPQR